MLSRYGLILSASLNLPTPPMPPASCICAELAILPSGRSALSSPEFSVRAVDLVMCVRDRRNCEESAVSLVKFRLRIRSTARATLRCCVPCWRLKLRMLLWLVSVLPWFWPCDTSSFCLWITQRAGCGFFFPGNCEFCIVGRLRSYEWRHGRFRSVSRVIVHIIMFLELNYLHEWIFLLIHKRKGFFCYNNWIVAFFLVSAGADSCNI